MAALVSACLVLEMAFAGAAFAWARHNLMSRAALEGVPWLRRFERLAVSADSYPDESLNPAYRPLYRNPSPRCRVNVPGEFVYYNLDSEDKWGFLGAEPGTMVDALQVLADFSDEPDWGMDKGLELAFAQKFMGGSQGYRHMYYPVGGFHLPWPFFAQGQAPRRARHFYRLADRSFAGGDFYWGFRFLARSMHYVQDLAQPYHGTQLYWPFFQLASPVSGTTQATKNYHFAYESLVAHLLELETAGDRPPVYLTLLRRSPALQAENLPRLLDEVVRQNCRLARDTFAACVELLGEEFSTSRPVPLTREKVRDVLQDPRWRELDLLIRKSLRLAAAGSKGLLELARRDFESFRAQPRRGVQPRAQE